MRESFSKGDHETLLDRWQVVLLSHHYTVAKAYMGTLHCGPAFTAAIDMMTEAIKEAKTEKYQKLGDAIKAYGAQIGLAGKVD